MADAKGYIRKVFTGMKIMRVFGIVVVLVIIISGFSAYEKRPLSAEERAQVNELWNPTPKFQTRGPAEQVRTVQASAAAITIDTDLITGVGAFMAAMAMIYALLVKHVIMPTLKAELEKLTKHYISRADMIVVLTSHNNDEALKRLQQMWEADAQNGATS